MTRGTTKYLIGLLLTLLSLMTVVGGAHASGTSNLLSSAQAEPEFLKVDQAFMFREEIVPGGVQLHWDIAPEYYLYLERFKFKALQDEVTLGEPEYSTQGKSKQDPYFGEVHVIHDYLSVFLPVDLGTLEDTELKVTYQGCAEAGLCYPPTHKQLMYLPISTAEASTTSNPLPVTAEVSTQVSTSAKPGPASERSLDDASGIFDFIQSSSLPMIVGIFFLLGLGLTFTPCVFPMIPIITSIIAGQEKPTAGKSFILSFSYVLGMALTYAAAGVATGLLGAGANVQAALQNPILLSVFAVVFFVLALAMFGLYELQLPSFIRDRLNNSSQNLSGGKLGSVFLIGALSALVVSPCVSAPLAGALLYISATADAVVGGLSLFALGMGMGVPLILISVGGGKLFPKAGKWMNGVKAVFGVMLVAVAIWLISRFAPASVTMVLWALLIGLSGVQMGAFEAAQSGWERILKGLGLLLALYAALLIIGASSGATNPLEPLERLGASAASTNSIAALSDKLEFTVIESIPELEQELATSNGQIVMVDFYADWCISCKVMEAEVFPIPGVKAKMAQMHLLKADVTDNESAHKELLDTFGLFGPPSILFFNTKGQEISELRIVGEVTAKDFEQRLSAALKQT